MRRRDFIKVIAVSAAGWPLAARAQQPQRMRRIGVLLFARPDRAIVSPLIQKLEALGYIEGKTAAIEYRDGNGMREYIIQAADELVRLNPEVIFAFGGDIAPIIKRATATIPIVAVVSNDPVASGLVQSLARPGGNITGLTQVHDALAGKSVELLKDIVPAVSRVAILWNPEHADPEFRETERAARALGVQLQSLEVRRPEDLAGAFQAAERERAEAMIVVGSRLLSLNRRLIGDFAAKHRMILLGNPAWLMEIGALVSYGPDEAELLRRAATYVDKILKGARPPDLPMQQPTTFDLSINMSIAKRLGITVPPTVIARADKVNE
jgi:putative ABC transport system substrate-binding protein